MGAKVVQYELQGNKVGVVTFVDKVRAEMVKVVVRFEQL